MNAADKLDMSVEVGMSALVTSETLGAEFTARPSHHLQ